MSNAKRKSELYELVKGLNSHEKAYYKKFAKRHAQQNNALHLQLFDVIDAAAENNDQLFAKKLKLSSGAQFSGLKSYLWNDLLATIVFLKRNESIHTQINFFIIQLEILINKGLTEAAQKLFDKAWKLALLHDLFDKQIALLSFKVHLDNYLPSHEYREASHESFEAVQKASARLAVYQQLDSLLNKLMLFRKTTYMRFSKQQTDDIEQLLSVAQRLVVPAESSLLSLLQKCTVAIAFHLSYRFEKSRSANEELLQLWQNAPVLIESNNMLFLYCVDNTMYNDFALNDVALADAHLKAYQELAKRYLITQSASAFWEITYFNSALKIFHKTARYDQVAQLMESRSKHILQLSAEALPRYRQITLLCSLCISCFVLELYSEAASYLEDIKRLNREEQSDDILYFSSIFQLIIFFENKEWDRLNIAIAASYLQLYNKKQLQPFEKEVMLFLKKFSSSWTKKEAQKAIGLFLEKLKVYKNDPVKKLYFLYFNYHGWLESKVMGIKYTEYTRRLLES